MSSQPMLNKGRIRQPGVYAAPTMLLNLDAELRSLNAEQPWQAGHTAKTIVKYPDMRIVLVALKAGARLVPHETTGRISIQTLAGCLRVRIPGQRVSVPAGSMIALDRDVPHEVSALVDSAFLLTIAWPLARERRVRPQAVSYKPVSIGEGVEPFLLRLARDAKREPAQIDDPHRWRQYGLDKTLADTFPCSDALSSIPDPKLSTA